MRKLIACAAICLLASLNVFADISYRNWRLDHALYPLHPPRLVIAGEIKEIKRGHMPGAESCRLKLKE